MSEKTKERLSLAAMIGILVVLVTAGIFISCNTLPVSYEKQTGIIECDIAIMTAKIKSREGYAAFEVSKFIDACFSRIIQKECKKEAFGEEKISYDKKDERYMNYLACLADRK